MRPLSLQDRESELSYAYIHAVAAKLGMGCEYACRHTDNNGVDAKITAWGPFPNGGFRQEVDIKVQLKATIKDLAESETHISYFLSGKSQYDDLRTEAVSTPRILVVLRLPKDDVDWLSLDAEQLIVRRCAYWTSLRNAPPADT
jgi:hypothetical protein